MGIREMNEGADEGRESPLCRAAGLAVNGVRDGSVVGARNGRGCEGRAVDDWMATGITAGVARDTAAHRDCSEVVCSTAIRAQANAIAAADFHLFLAE